MKHTMSFRIEPKMRKQLDKLGKKTGMQVSDLVRESLRRYLAVATFHSTRDKILPFAESRGLLTDEDVFESLS